MARLHPVATDPRQRRLTSEAAQQYVAARNPDRYQRRAREEEFVRAWLSSLPANALVWDCPCGTGRFVNTALEMGFRYVGGDFSPAMIAHARKTATDPRIAGFVRCDASMLPLGDHSVDCVILWRLLHHIRDADTRLAMLREAARVSRLCVLVSFHHPLSFTALRCFVERKVLGGTRGGSEITHWRLQREAARCGLQLLETKSYRKFVSINWFALLRQATHADLSPSK